MVTAKAVSRKNSEPMRDHFGIRYNATSRFGDAAYDPLRDQMRQTSAAHQDLQLAVLEVLNMLLGFGLSRERCRRVKSGPEYSWYVMDRQRQRQVINLVHMTGTESL